MKPDRPGLIHLSFCLIFLFGLGCSSSSGDSQQIPDTVEDQAVEEVESDTADSVQPDSETLDTLDSRSDIQPAPLQGLHGQCVSLRSGDQWLSRDSETAYAFSDTAEDAERFTLQAADLETYLFYDTDAGYLIDLDGQLGRATQLDSDVSLNVDVYVSEAEWIFENSSDDPSKYVLHNHRSDNWLGLDGVGEDTAPVVLEPAEGCREYPEMSLDATGTIQRTTFEDGTLYGIADIHEHIMSDISFGGGLYHGAAFHRLGVEHALPDCYVVHGEEGKRDFFGYVTDHAGIGGDALMMLLDAFFEGELPVHNHNTAGWPEFTDWPNARKASSHQAMYYRWIERSYMAGLRLMVQLATSDYVICGLMDGGGLQPKKHSCDDMESVDRIIEETWAMQRYIDAQHGGEGKGWFRVVKSPAEAREVIAQGKMAVILGIETSNPFQCYLTPRPGGPTCDKAWVESQLDEYFERGIRSVFPVHKYDNRFSPGDGSRGFLQIGSFLVSGHWLNLTQECPDNGMPKAFDSGPVTFSGLLKPRDEYLSEPPEDLSDFVNDPLAVAMRYTSEILEPEAEGEWCQNATFSPVGLALLDGLMSRGMLIETAHLPQWSYLEAVDILEANDYPWLGTHGRHWNGRIYHTGGMATYGVGRCQNPDDPGSTLNGLWHHVELIEGAGGYPGVPLGFDFNGVAGSPGPRFGEEGCGGEEQPDPITYPFTSYDGDVEFTQPYLGNRAVDFNTEGMIHIGMLPELIQDARSDAQDDSKLEPLFRSAEAYIRMWEKAEQRGAAIQEQRNN